MLKGFVSDEEKNIKRIPMKVGNEYKEGWEVRDDQDRIIWGREDEFQTTTGTLPFKGYGLPVKVKSLLGNTFQNGTPTPETPVMPEFVGTLDGTDWTIPITTAGQTTTIYLSEVPTVRRIRKMRLLNPSSTVQTETGYRLVFSISEHPAIQYASGGGFCNIATWQGDYDKIGFVASIKYAYITQNIAEWATVEGATAWLEENEVYIWYVLAEPETAIINDPLFKIVDYADELNNTVVTLPEIPTTTGQNTLTVDTTLSPSSLTVKGHIKELT